MIKHRKIKNQKDAKPRFVYEPEGDVLSWEINKEPIDYAEEAGNMVVHFNKKNRPVLVEILNAKDFFVSGKNLVNKQALKNIVKV